MESPMSDLRSNLIRLAATMPKGSANRKALLDVLGTEKEASDTWMRRLEPIQAGFMREVVAEAESILGDAGVTKIQTGPNFITGVLQGEKLSIYWMWQNGDIVSKMTVGSDRRQGTHLPLSMSPMNVASESIYKHFQGLLE